jgi:hypothetical protein
MAERYGKNSSLPGQEKFQLLMNTDLQLWVGQEVGISGREE